MVPEDEVEHYIQNESELFSKAATKAFKEGIINEGLTNLTSKYSIALTFIDGLKLFYHVANIGDVRSLAIHPSSTTHSQLSKEDQKKAGVYDNYIRLSIGIEHIEVIISDLENALSSI